MKILIIDDEKVYRESLRDTCLNAAHDLTIEESTLDFDYARDLKEARDKLTRKDYDLVIADIGLPGGDDVFPFHDLKSIMGRDVLGEAKLILITGKDQFFTFEKFKKAIYQGAFSFIHRTGKENESPLCQIKRAMLQIDHDSWRRMLGESVPLPLRKEFEKREVRRQLELGIWTKKAVLWCDLAGSTDFVQLQRQRGCQEEYIVKFFQSFFTVHSEIIYAHGGVIDKFIGDEILAYFSFEVKESYRNQCHKAIDAAIQVRDNYGEWYNEIIDLWPFRKPVKKRPEPRILVHFGEVIWAVLGSIWHSDLTLMTLTMVNGKRILDHYNDGNIRAIPEGQMYITQDVLARIDKTRYEKDEKEMAWNVRHVGDVPIYRIINRA